MTVREFIETKGWGFEASLHHHYMTVRIQFINSDNREDETEFDIFAYDVDELISLFETFCKENNFTTDTVTDVYVVKSARTMEVLEEE